MTALRKALLFLSLTALTLAVHSCDGKGGKKDNVPEPYIISISTDYEGKAVAGKAVTLNGLNFSPVAAENKVLYGVGLDATALRVSESSEEHVVFTAPDLGKSSVKIRVSVNGVESNSVLLEYATADPEDESIVLEDATTVTVAPGVEWTSFHGNWENQVRNINIVRTTLDGKNHLGIYFNYGETYPDGYTPTVGKDEDPRDLDKKCIYLDAMAATNGPMACCQFVRVNGNQEHGPGDADEWIANCAITIDGDKVDIVQVKDNYKAAKLTNAADGESFLPPDNTLTVGCAGPLLVWEGKVQKNPEAWKKLDTSGWLNDPSPRTAIGLSSDGKTIIQVAVDGRWTQSSFDQRAVGMSTELLAKLMRGLGCYKAMNFDGGGGTAMWVKGYGNSRNIVNRVSENRWNWDGTKLRATGCAVYIKRSTE